MDHNSQKKGGKLPLLLPGVQRWTQMNNNERAECHRGVTKYTSKLVQLIAR